MDTNSAHSDMVATANMTPVPPPNAPNKSERTNIKPATAPPKYNDNNSNNDSHSNSSSSNSNNNNTNNSNNNNNNNCNNDINYINN